MKPTLFSPLAAATLVATFPSAAHAKPKKGAPAPAAPAKQASQSPSEMLAPFVENIDEILALKHEPNAPPIVTSAGGRIAIVKNKLVEQRAKAENRAPYDAAIQTADLIASAVDERAKVYAQIKASEPVTGDTRLGAHRADELPKGKWGRITGLARERDEKAEAAARAAREDDSFTAAARKRWVDRKVELRKQISASYARITAG